jgi:hypothetical protein
MLIKMQQAAQNPTPPRHLDGNQVGFLQSYGFTSGLIQAIALNANRFPLRLWVLDNSSSMQSTDAHILRGSTMQQLVSMPCSRWQEVQESVGFFCNMAATLQLPTRFVLLNELGRMFGPSTFSIGQQGPANIPSDYQNAITILNRAYPSGATPLANHIDRIRAFLLPMAPQLQREGKRVTIVLATDGLPSDENGNEGEFIFQKFVQSLKSLEQLPVWVVVRLCTDDEKVIDFYNSIDRHMNLPYDVLDDYFGEALEVYLRNPWLNYALPIHRYRELGIHHAVLDSLDEQALAYEEVHQLCCLLFQNGQQFLPNPSLDWLGFLRNLSNLLKQENWQFHPITKTLAPLIDLRRLHLVYGRGVPFPPDLHTQWPLQPQTTPQTQIPTPNPGYHNPQQSSYPSRPPQQHSQPHMSSGFQSQIPPSSFADPPQAVPPKHPTSKPPPPAPASPGFDTAKYGGSSSTGDRSAALKQQILQWAVQGHQGLKPIDFILATVHQTFPPSYGVATHPYFQKWKPFAQDALVKREASVLKRGM